MKRVCLPLNAETQALGSTGFHELRESILGLDESKTAYDTIGVDVPYTRCMFVAGLTKWAETVNKGLLDYLEKISKGECVKALNVNYARFSNKDYWLRGRMKNDMTTYSDIPLKLNTGQCEYASSLDLYKAYEPNRLTPVFASLRVWNMVGGPPFICSRVPIIINIGCLPSEQLSTGGRHLTRI